MVDLGQVHPGADDVADTGSGLLERVGDVAQSLDGLSVWISHANDPPLCVSRGRPRNVDNPANPDRPRVTNHRLPRRAAGDVLPAHGLSIGAAFHVTWEVVPLAFASATRSSVARMISSTPRGGLRKVTPPMLGVAGEPSVIRRSIRPARSFSRTMREAARRSDRDRKSTRLNSSHGYISYAVFCLKKKKKQKETILTML